MPESLLPTTFNGDLSLGPLQPNWSKRSCVQRVTSAPESNRACVQRDTPDVGSVRTIGTIDNLTRCDIAERLEFSNEVRFRLNVSCCEWFS